MSILDTILALSSGTYDVTRYEPSSYDDNGRLVEGASSTLQVVASVQPISGRELLRLDEGLRTKEPLAIWSTTALRTADAQAGTRADRLTVGGLTYEVQLVEDWSASGGGWKSVAAKVEA